MGPAAGAPGLALSGGAGVSHYHKRAGILGRYARRWARLRRVVLDAANWRCSRCGRYANEVDHVVPLEKGGDAWKLANLQALCRACQRKTGDH